MGGGSVIICNKPNFEVRSWSWEPSELVLSISHHSLDLALKSPISIARNDLQLDNNQGLVLDLIWMFEIRLVFD